jgi:hypothetical protein
MGRWQAPQAADGGVIFQTLKQKTPPGAWRMRRTGFGFALSRLWEWGMAGNSASWRGV